MTKELVVISGKGGTGKTSLTASFALLAKHPVVADGDVDASDMPLILSPRVMETHEFRGGHEARIREEECTRCGLCLFHCRFQAVKVSLVAQAACGVVFAIDPLACEGCGVCVRFCPVDAIDFPERVCGEWMVSQTRCGPMVHARLGVGAENSGKLVSTVRREARALAEREGYPLVIIDGPPGIGCPVIASVTGTSKALVVTEPTLSGEHDMERVLALARHFEVAATVCVNKWDINPTMTERIEGRARERGADVAGRIRYDPGVTQAQLKERAVVEIDTPAAEDIRHIWDHLGLED